ncbi:MOB kinase activator-like 1A isoform X2 [Olea europaea var. sylvestris]|uniref:MOB kinase activator-like 1A n=1 Tax=Olea europaea subsp. europaea TaxID=158383 RepID=A0A8S0UAJ8_OLEEU|nr:MOB kinase activator-like 1A isoform X2 [Olea europaea var. sylvestris]CAA3016412.1 Hypothetical predicted protein [Olea europaea subsp. europaea]
MSLLGLGSRNQKTFRPKKSAPSGSKGLQLQKHIDATLGSGNLREAVRLPPGEDLNEWLAVNTVDFFNQVNLLYGTLTEFCTASTCPTMSAGSKYEYRWADGITIKQPIEVSAPKYVEYLMDWIEAQLDDESIFPQNCTISTQLSGCCENHIQAVVSRVCPYLPFTFPEDCESKGRSSSEYLL